MCDWYRNLWKTLEKFGTLVVSNYDSTSSCNIHHMKVSICLRSLDMVTSSFQFFLPCSSKIMTGEQHSSFFKLKLEFTFMDVNNTSFRQFGSTHCISQLTNQQWMESPLLVVDWINIIPTHYTAYAIGELINYGLPVLLDTFGNPEMATD